MHKPFPENNERFLEPYVQLVSQDEIDKYNMKSPSIINDAQINIGPEYGSDL